MVMSPAEFEKKHDTIEKALILLDTAGYAILNQWHISDVLKLYENICPDCALTYLNDALQDDDVLKLVYLKLDERIRKQIEDNKKGGTNIRCVP